jgi:hypothetical protein
LDEEKNQQIVKTKITAEAPGEAESSADIAAQDENQTHAVSSTEEEDTEDEMNLAWHW